MKNTRVHKSLTETSTSTPSIRRSGPRTDPTNTNRVPSTGLGAACGEWEHESPAQLRVIMSCPLHHRQRRRDHLRQEKRSNLPTRRGRRRRRRRSGTTAPTAGPRALEAGRCLAQGPGLPERRVCRPGKHIFEKGANVSLSSLFIRSV